MDLVDPAADLRERITLRLRLLRAFAELPQKMPALLEIYRTASAGDDEISIHQVAELFGGDMVVAQAINNQPLGWVHPYRLQAIREEIESLEAQLDALEGERS
ncbi:hypothetical protein [Kribbella speibonae]|uniref:Uncharacterized protein n=1 Tax=Kribbella speibonae TaxID=1572660 RepID=A0A4R0J4C3_9ACTN|nr:hypothetical protein [Kribbella speibonae]TCC20797.1 hypothetical protein E0H58_25975 [Kribbella speibonae]TCC40799.1 hypothetical protein E0H92_03685 [Kribbella speibonae]